MQKLSISIAALAPVVSVICDGLKDTAPSTAWDMNCATAYMISKMMFIKWKDSIKGEITRNADENKMI